jgi:ribonuclease HII
MANHGDAASADPDLSRELKARAAGLWPVCGLDEAGRGPLAGPVVAACVVLNLQRVPSGLRDSKRLTEAAREALHDEIRRTARVGVGIAEVDVIERLNIHGATLWAMARAFEAVGSPPPRLALVDGNHAPKLPCACETIVGGDATVASIAAASIVAKVVRDRIMRRLDAQYPGYGFAEHKGYAVPAHREALRRLGPCPAHRRGFAPVRALLNEDEDGRNAQPRLPLDES